MNINPHVICDGIAGPEPLRGRCVGSTAALALPLPEGPGDGGRVDEVGAFEVGDGAADAPADPMPRRYTRRQHSREGGAMGLRL